MKLKDLINVLDGNAMLYIVSEDGHWLYRDKVVFITSDLLERTVKLLDINIIGKFLLNWRDKK